MIGSILRVLFAIAACAAVTIRANAADVRFDFVGKPTRSAGGTLYGNRTVVLEGIIEKGDYEKLKAIYQDRLIEFDLDLGYFTQLSLASPGGDLAEAMKIGRFVRALKLQTIIPAKSEFASPSHFGKFGEHNVNKKNYLCASACIFIFAAGIKRETDDGLSNPLLAVHRPYLSANELKAITGEQAISSENQIRATVENYIKEMNVPAKYVGLMLSIPKDEARWVTEAEFHADFDGAIPELRDWLSAKCDSRTDVEKALWKRMMADKRPMGQQSASDRSMFDMMSKKMSEVRVCEDQQLIQLSAKAWLQMFDPTCSFIKREITDWQALAPDAAKDFCN